MKNHLIADPSDNTRAITKKVFAQRWMLSERFVADLMSDGVIPIVKLGRRCVRIPIPEADEALLRYSTDI